MSNRKLPIASLFSAIDLFRHLVENGVEARIRFIGWNHVEMVHNEGEGEILRRHRKT